MTGPQDPAAAGLDRLRAGHADREQAIDTLKTAFVSGQLTKDELDARAGQALAARTYADLAALTAGLTLGTPRVASRPAMQAPRRRVSKKVVALSACAVVLPITLSMAFLTYYGGFLVMMLFTFIGAVLLSKPPAPPRPPLAKSIGGKH